MQYLKTKSLTGEYVHVLKDDQALDQKADGFDAAYKRALETGDFSAVPRSQGLEPAIWKLRHLTEPEWRYVQDVSGRYGLNSACYEAVALSLLGVKGVDLDIERTPASSRRGFPSVLPEQMEQLTADVVNELGFRVIGERGPRNG